MSLAPVNPRRPLLWPELVAELAARAPDPSRLYLVGGMVRDALRGVPIHDYDLATPDDGLHIARCLADALGARYYPVDAARRTGRVILAAPDGPLQIDVASFRGNDLLIDLTGRDFTVNAIAVRLDQPAEIIDPLGGQADLFDHKILRQCSPTSVADDPIRALRAVRHAQQFRLRIETATLAAVRAAAPHLLDESGALRQPERARDELFKTLSTARPAASLRLLHALGLWQALAPQPLREAAGFPLPLATAMHLSDLFAIISPRRDDNLAADLTLGVAVMVLDRYRRQLQEYLSQTFADGRPLTALLTLGALAPVDLPDPARSWAERLRLSNAEQHTLGALHAARALLAAGPPLDSRSMHRYYRDVGETGIAGVLVMLAEFLAAHPPAPEPQTWGHLLDQVAAPLLNAFFRRHQQIVAPPPLLNGDDLIAALAIAPGPRVGRLLALLAEAQAASEIHSKKEALELAQRLLNAGL